MRTRLWSPERCLLCLVCWLLACPLMAVPSPADSPELLLFEDFPEVVSGARQPQPQPLAAVPISVITAEEIHDSGLSSVAELLTFVPGVDVVAIGNQDFAVGVRGLHDTFSERTLSLVDGRLADNPVFGGSELRRLPILLEDLERIEIVRGPGSAAWGAGAFTGVIHLITKEPSATQGFLLSSTFNEDGDISSHLRWGGANEAWSWRFSLGFQDRQSTLEVSDNHFSSLMLDSRADRQISEHTAASFGLASALLDIGGFGPFDPTNQLPDGEQRDFRAFVRIDHEFTENMRGYVEWYGNFLTSERTVLTDNASDSNHVEVQLDLTPGREHSLSLGAQGDFTHVETENSEADDLTILGAPLSERFLSAFAIDRRHAGRWTLETQARFDDYSETSSDVSGRLTALHSLGSQGRHTLRLAAARAFRTPLSALRRSSGSVGEIAPGIFLITIQPPREPLENEETWALEAGYSLVKSFWSFHLDVYFQSFEDLIGFDFQQRPITPGLVTTTAMPANLARAESRGGEMVFTLTGQRGGLNVWYAFSDFQLDQPGKNLRAFLPAEHKVGLNGRLRISEHWRGHFAYKFASEVPAVTGNFFSRTVDASHRLDVSAAWSLFKDRLEILFGIEDAFDETRRPAIAGLGTNNLGREAFLRLTVRR